MKHSTLIGSGLIVAGIIFSGLLYFFYVQETSYINALIEKAGTCFLDDGTCLHADRNTVGYTVGWVLSVILIGIGGYVLYFSRVNKTLTQQQREISSVLKEVKEKDTFLAFVSGFTEDEQTILKVLKEHDGIKQSTLRYKTGIAKAKLSLLLKSLEDRDIISRTHVGKTNQVFLRAKF